MATKSTPCPVQKAASAAMPSTLLAKLALIPSRPMRACKDWDETSTPQITRVTVTFLVSAIEKSCDCSVVRDLGSGPGAERRSLRPQDEREPPARGGAHAWVPPPQQFLLSQPSLS